MPYGFIFLLFSLFLIESPVIGAPFKSPDSRRLTPEIEGRSGRPRLDSPEKLASAALSEPVLQLLDGMAQDLLIRYPPLVYDYVSVGTSPSLLVEVLRSRARAEGSSVRLFHLPLSFSQIQVYDQAPDLRFAVQQAFGPFSLTGDRPVVFLDYAMSGRTLTLLAAGLRNLERDGTFTRPFILSGFYSQKEDNLPAKLRLDLRRLVQPALADSQIDLRPLPRGLDPFFAFRAFKQFSPYVSWPARLLGNSAVPLIPVDPREKVIADASYARHFSIEEMQARLLEFFTPSRPGLNGRFCHQIHRQ